MESQKGNSGEAENNVGVGVGVGGSSGGGNNTSSGSRWNPTKEQISMLENLYKQGIRTPSAEQIEQITARLRAYGQIEGKNVFYWFQNHKARQRQRQKQQQLQSNNNAFFNRFLHTPHPPPFSSPLCQNVVCTPSPFCLPQSDFGFYPQPPNMLETGPISPRAENVGGPMMVVMPRMYDGRPIYDPWQQRIPDYSICHSNPKTLDLFPQHPTGTMEEGKTTEHVVSAENQPCFDFFTLGKGPRFTD